MIKSNYVIKSDHPCLFRRLQKIFQNYNRIKYLYCLTNRQLNLILVTIINQLIFVKYLLHTAQNHNCNLIDNEHEWDHLLCPSNCRSWCSNYTFSLKMQ